MAVFGKICLSLTELQKGQCCHLCYSAVALLNYWGRHCEHSVWTKCVSVSFKLLLPYMIHVTYKLYHSKSLDVWAKTLCCTVIRIDMHHNFIAYWNPEKMKQTFWKLPENLVTNHIMILWKKIDGYMLILQRTESIFPLRKRENITKHPKY